MISTFRTSRDKALRSSGIVAILHRHCWHQHLPPVFAASEFKISSRKRSQTSLPPSEKSY